MSSWVKHSVEGTEFPLCTVFRSWSLTVTDLGICHTDVLGHDHISTWKDQDSITHSFEYKRYWISVTFLLSSWWCTRIIGEPYEIPDWLSSYSCDPPPPPPVPPKGGGGGGGEEEEERELCPVLGRMWAWQWLTCNGCDVIDIIWHDVNWLTEMAQKSDREGEKKRKVRERERENSNSKTLFSKDCSLGSFRPA